jgi:hypothetical protein
VAEDIRKAKSAVYNIDTMGIKSQQKLEEGKDGPVTPMEFQINDSMNEEEKQRVLAM